MKLKEILHMEEVMKKYLIIVGIGFQKLKNIKKNARS